MSEDTKQGTKPQRVTIAQREGRTPRGLDRLTGNTSSDTTHAENDVQERVETTTVHSTEPQLDKKEDEKAKKLMTYKATYYISRKEDKALLKMLGNRLGDDEDDDIQPQRRKGEADKSALVREAIQLLAAVDGDVHFQEMLSRRVEKLGQPDGTDRFKLIREQTRQLVHEAIQLLCQSGSEI